MAELLLLNESAADVRRQRERSDGGNKWPKLTLYFPVPIAGPIRGTTITKFLNLKQKNFNFQKRNIKNFTILKKLF